jgi:hypothetical protein
MRTSKALAQGAGARVDDTPSVDVTWYGPTILEVTWSGHVDGASVAEALRKVIELRGERTVQIVIINTVDVIGYRVDVRSPSIRFMEYFRTLNVKEFVGIIPNSAVRMFASTMSVLMRMKFPLFASRNEAAVYLSTAAD